MPVRDERAALVHAAAEGIGIAAGSPFVVDPETSPSGGDRVRVTAGSVVENVRLVAEALARAASAAPLA